MPKITAKTFKSQLATLKTSIPTGDEWIHEIKYDGYRTFGIKIGPKVFMMTRNGNDWTETYQILANDLKKLPFENIVLDGEICILDPDGVTNFNKLQNSVGRNSFKKNVKGLVFYAFDLLYLDHEDLRILPLIERKEKLKKISKKLSKNYLYSDHFEIPDSKKVLKEFCKLNLEGVISKRKNAPYRGGRNEDWIKTKCQKNDEFIVIGYLPGATHPFGALLLGEYKQNVLTYAGKVGTGFTNEMKNKFLKQTRLLKQEVSPLKEVPKGLKAAIWLKPKLIAEVNFLVKTEQGFRHSAFKTFRTDKTLKDLKK